MGIFYYYGRDNLDISHFPIAYYTAGTSYRSNNNL